MLREFPSSHHQTIPPPDYPIEYLDGSVIFFGREFTVTPDVLIPRLETESLVRRARKLLSSTHSPTTIIDIGCGSGIIGTSVADLADEVIFLDISSEALQIAEQNFRAHFPEKKAQFILSDLLSNFQLPTSNSQLLFLANLPYIKQDDWDNMSADTVHEPRLALFGGEKTGFELYERLFDQLSQIAHLMTDGREFAQIAPLIRGEGGFTQWNCLFEFGFDQREIAEATLKQYPEWEYSFFPDYAGVERFGQLKNLKRE